MNESTNQDVAIAQNLYSMLYDILKAGTSSQLKIEMKFKDPEDCINLPSYTSSEKEDADRVWSSWRIGNENHYCVFSAPQAVNIFEEALLDAHTNGQIKYPEVI